MGTVSSAGYTYDPQHPPILDDGSRGGYSGADWQPSADARPLVSAPRPTRVSSVPPPLPPRPVLPPPPAFSEELHHASMASEAAAPVAPVVARVPSLTRKGSRPLDLESKHPASAAQEDHQPPSFMQPPLPRRTSSEHKESLDVANHGSLSLSPLPPVPAYAPPLPPPLSPLTAPAQADAPPALPPRPAAAAAAGGGGGDDHADEDDFERIPSPTSDFFRDMPLQQQQQQQNNPPRRFFSKRHYTLHRPGHDTVALAPSALDPQKLAVPPGTNPYLRALPPNIAQSLIGAPQHQPPPSRSPNTFDVYAPPPYSLATISPPPPAYNAEANHLADKSGMAHKPRSFQLTTKHDLSKLLSSASRDYLLNSRLEPIPISVLLSTAEKLRDPLVDPSSRGAAKAKLIALYFTSLALISRAPYRDAAATLVQVYQEMIAHHLDLEIVFVPIAGSEADFLTALSTMPWLALPFEDQRKIRELERLFNVHGQPQLVVLNGEGYVTNKDAMELISKVGTAAFPFYEQPLPSLPPPLPAVVGVFPSTARNPRHQHVLSLSVCKYTTGYFYCGACFSYGKGLCYQCPAPSCHFHLHPDCACPPPPPPNAIIAPRKPMYSTSAGGYRGAIERKESLSPRAPRAALPVAPPAPPPPSNARGIYYCLFDFRAQSPSDASFKKDDVVEVVSSAAPGWFKARHVGTNKVGLIPANYLRLMP